jgi:glycosyltransferase involved in cell wall biosynthesis
MIDPSTSQRPLRVALVTRSMMMGGAQRHIVKLCQTAPRERVSLSLFLLVRDEAQDLLPEIPPDVPVFISPLRRHHPLASGWLAAKLRALQIDVAHSFLWTADAYASLAGLLVPSIPVVASERGDRAPTMYSAARNLVDRLATFRVARRMCANSQFGRRLLIEAGCHPAKIDVINNGVELARIDSHPHVDVRRLAGWPVGVPIVGTVSRLTHYKGVDVLLRAIAQLEPDLSAHCVIVGDGPERAALERLATDLGVADRIAFLGTRSPSEPFARDFDIAVLTTRTSTEHFSNSILEYMALGRPVVATDIGGNPELVVSGENGLLVPPDDDAALARALGELLADPARARRMGALARARVEREFQMEHSVARFIELWRTCAHSGVYSPSMACAQGVSDEE